MLIPTIKVKLRSRPDFQMIINQADYDPLLHEVVTETSAPAPPPPPSTPSTPVDTTPGDISTVNGIQAKEVIDKVTDLAKLDELEILERLHITDIQDKLPGEISEGQKKRVGLARAIIMKPEIMLYDEPTTGQDPIRTRQVDDMIQEAQQEFDITSIVISHDMASTFRIAHMIALLNRGQIAAYGTPDQVRASADDHVQHFIYAGQVDA